MFVKAVSKLIQILWGKNGIQVAYLSPAKLCTNLGLQEYKLRGKKSN